MFMRLCVVLLLCLPVSLSAAEKARVVTTFSILADITREIGGDDIQLTNLVGADADAHVFEPAPAQVRAVLEADLVIANGLGFEPWLERLLANGEARGTRIDASKGVVPMTVLEDDQRLVDPHAWQSLGNAEIYARNITQALVQLVPARAAAFEARRDSWLGRLGALRQSIAPRLMALPPERRRVLTSHDAFGYFAQEWRLQFLAAQGVSDAAEPSAAEVAGLIRQLRAEGVRAIFVENIRDARLVKQIAEEAGARVGGTLYSDALAAEGPASTYLGMYRQNVERLLQALAP
ncbi:zinc/manganese transport system substrate-binding protein [Pseudomonas sp. SLBN-26]|jgi:zinc/manganese transport system substrate-binding protein|uniref:Metal ABC transporter substrate-binding protein n=2 Tax=Metapseudomonas otitidis TaxID=319939 RepID=A0A679GMS8_9GAMM|nr:Zinc ABC transporter, periplasmic-binding protein ZnuA [Pseudomonas sp. FeS53a]MCP1620288.1 zinc/manganese transport system substrate-binding protein [Pseudomonas otitidis]TQL09501.1 zinc/manganese transport system substrate-binding protein [Pseudomonas sp. SLBN-26]BBT18787.1 metal ABC transporter substrate-binding protein [Pseudomonas otitidis]BCA30795.1 metal ABC transporter substrate-binding protein [Pseudomonas otitidis]